jgi:hypothetical protein
MVRPPDQDTPRDVTVCPRSGGGLRQPGTHMTGPGFWIAVLVGQAEQGIWC